MFSAKCTFLHRFYNQVLLTNVITYSMRELELGLIADIRNFHEIPAVTVPATPPWPVSSGGSHRLGQVWVIFSRWETDRDKLER